MIILASQKNHLKNNVERSHNPSIWPHFVVVKNQHANKIAISTHSRHITYFQLYLKSKKLGKYLAKHKVKRIALLFNQGIEMVVAMLSALRHHITYIPIDPTRSDSCIKNILCDSQATHILVDHFNRSKIDSLIKEDGIKIEISIYNQEIFIISFKEAKLNICDKSSIKPHITPAYILYTSGSTGEPKGVVQTQYNILLHISNYSKALKITEKDNLNIFASYAFDAAVMDIYGAILNGATLYPFEIKNTDPKFITNYLVENNITILHLVPTVFRCLIRIVKKGDWTNKIRFVVLGGEMVTKEDVELFRKSFSDKTILVNGYGPTECTIACQYHIDSNCYVENNKIPIGRSVGNTIFFLKKSSNKEKVGEIVLQGRGVAYGYWNNANATKKSFKICEKTGINLTYPLILNNP